MLKCIDFKRLVNFIKINLSYLLSSITGSFFLWGKPFALSIETSGTCQLECKECPLGSGDNKSRDHLPFNDYKKLINEAGSHVFIINLYFQGEPLLNNNINNYIKLLKEKNIYSIISTNGNFDSEKTAKMLVESGLNELIISVDGSNQEIYEKYRKGGNLKKVINFIENIKSAKKQLNKKNPKLYIQTLISRDNEHDLHNIKSLAKDLNIKAQFKTMQLTHFDNPEILPLDKNYRRYISDKNKYPLIKNKLKSRCKRVLTNPVITGNGNMVPCCFDKNEKYKYGNIKTNSFNEIWSSDRCREFIKKVFTERKNIDICNNCTEGTKPVYVKNIPVNRR